MTFKTDKYNIQTGNYQKKHIFPRFPGQTNTTFKMVKNNIYDNQKTKNHLLYELPHLLFYFFTVLSDHLLYRIPLQIYFQPICLRSHRTLTAILFIFFLYHYVHRNCTPVLVILSLVLRPFPGSLGLTCSLSNNVLSIGGTSNNATTQYLLYSLLSHPLSLSFPF